VVDSDARAEEPSSREEVLARHEPIQTYKRPRRKQVTGVWEVILIAWAMLREPEERLQPAAKVFLGATLFTWLFFVFAELWIVY